MEKLLIRLAIGFVLRQIATYKAKTDWTKVKADFATRVRDVLPGDALDDMGADLASSLIDGVASVLGCSANLQLVLEKLAGKDWDGAVTAVRQLLLTCWAPKPGTPAADAQAVVKQIALQVNLLPKPKAKK